MPDGLDVIIVDDDPNVCNVIQEIVEKFYVWGDVIAFSDPQAAKAFCMNRDVGLAIFIVDVFLGGLSGFLFLDTLGEKSPDAHENTIIITGQASDDIVNMCVASDVNYLLEKPIKAHALQLAVRAIASKYLKFAKKILSDPRFAKLVEKY